LLTATGLRNMRSFALALLIVAISASPAGAAVIELDDRSSPEDSAPLIAIVVRAAPGETNDITVTRVSDGIMIVDTGAPLTGECEPSAAGRLCRGDDFGPVDVLLGDGNDTLDHDAAASGLVEGGEGDDDISVSGFVFDMVGGAGADRLDATDAMTATVSYADHSADVTVRLNDLADDGAAGEGDNVLGPVTGIAGGAGNDRLEAGPRASGLAGLGGDDTLVGSPERDTLNGGPGDDELLGRGGHDFLIGDTGADVLSGGEDLDEVSYGGSAPLRLSIGDGANDGAAGEGDDIRGDVESLTGGFGDDVLIGDERANRLIAYGGHDVLRGMGGADEIIGWGDGDELDGGAGSDRVDTRARRRASVDRALLRDGERDRLTCHGTAPFIRADARDRLKECAPGVVVHRHGPVRRNHRVLLFARCPQQSTVSCRGRLWLHAQGPRGRPHAGRRLTRVVRLGRIAPGERRRVRLLVRGRVPRQGCVYASTVTRRPGLRTKTATLTVLSCSPG
jgi:hypothetical protein